MFLLFCITHIFILRSEARSRGLIDNHNHSHYDIAIHDGGGQNILCLILLELINPVAEVVVLKESKYIVFMLLS